MMLAFAIAALWYASAYSESIQPGSFRSFSVTGEGKVVAVPDVARFTFGVISETTGADIVKLQAENTEKMNRIIAILKTASIDSKDIKTEQYRLSPRYQYCGPDARFCPPPQIVGYSIEQQLSVKVRKFDQLGGILSQVVTAGATNVSQVEFTIDDPIKLENEARVKAIAEARTKAKAVARAGGFRIGKLLSVDEAGPVHPFLAERSAFGLGGAADAVFSMPPQPALEPGSTDIVVNVILRYEIN